MDLRPTQRKLNDMDDYAPRASSKKSCYNINWNLFVEYKVEKKKIQMN